MDATMISALIAGVLGVAAHVGGGGGKSLTPGRRKNSRRPQAKSVGPSGMNPSKSSDLAVRPPSIFDVPRRIPRNLANQQVTLLFKVDSTITSSSTALVETNYSFNLSTNPQYANWTAVWDQYCLIQASVVFDSGLPPGSTASPPRLFTALDFDGVAGLGAVSAIEEYATCEVINMEPGTRHVRSVRPCPKLQVTSSAAVVPQQSWVDCANASIPHYGIRSIVAITGVAALPINVTVSLWVTFRSGI